MGTDLDLLDDLFLDEEVDNAKRGSKFQPKAKFRPAKKPLASASIAKSQPQNTPSGSTELGIAKPLDESYHWAPEDKGSWNASKGKSVEGSSDIFIGLENHGNVPHLSATAESNRSASESVSADDSNSRTPGEDVDLLTVSTISRDDVHGRTNDQELVAGEMEVLRSLHVDELISESGQGAGQRMDGETCEASKLVSCSLDAFEIDDSMKDSSPTFQQDDVIDISSLGFPEDVAMPWLHSEDSCHDNTGSYNANEELDVPSQHQSQSARCLDEKADQLLSQKGHDTVNEVLPSVEFLGEHPSSTAMEEENSVDGELQTENEKTGNVVPSSRKNKRPTAKKRKKSEKVLPEAPNQKPKKFTHSTRRRRVVDKALLETPEDDIDYQNTPLRDLILLAEHKERQMKKEAAGRAQQSKRSGGSSHENETLNPDVEGEPELEDTTLFFNYQTYMNKPKTIRWSKQDTELFYEAIQQFGTDLSLIQQLFPRLSRRQIKLKYKKEERQHPMRLHQALSIRSKDHSHFEKVIERLKQVADEERRNAEEEEDEEDGEMDEGSSVAHENGEAKEENEHVKEDENGNDAPHDYVETGSPLKLDVDEDEDDDDEFYQYKSV